MSNTERRLHAFNPDKSPVRIAVVHDWLVTFAGAERALRAILELYPDADLFAVIDFLSEQDRARIFGKRATTTFIQKLPFAKTRYRSYLPFMPLAIEQLDLSAYDLVISSSHAVAKGVITGPDQVHVCNCYTPIRYAWDMQHQYLMETRLHHGLKSLIARLVLHYIRLWDVRTAVNVDRFIAISAFIARRIKKVYGRDSDIVYAPIELVDIIVHSSIAPEPFGRVVVEGLLAGKPVVASAAGGVLEIIEDGKTGWLVEPGNAEALAETLRIVLENEVESTKIADAGQAHARATFTIAATVKQIDEALRLC